MDQSAVIATNDDATSCKAFSVSLGYWHDPYIQHFISHRRPYMPEITRGYFARVKCVEHLLMQFVQQHSRHGPVQVLSLGAGFDTLYWRMRDQGVQFYKFVEFDLLPVVRRKIQTIRRSSTLWFPSNNNDDKSYESHAFNRDNYSLKSVDLEDTPSVEGAIRSSTMDPSRPTFILAECVLVYLRPHSVCELLRLLVKTFHTSVFVNYEMIDLNDKFGQIMVDNLLRRNCHLKGVEFCQNEKSFLSRFACSGWSGSRLWRMIDVYQRVPDLARVESLQILDDLDVLAQLLSHYAVSVAYSTDTGDRRCDDYGVAQLELF